jgi:PAS domain S-box-containing protein
MRGRAAEELMDQSEQPTAALTDEGRYRLLVDAITDYAVYMLDRQGVVTSWNPGAQRFKGYTAEEILGRHFSTFYTPEDRAAGLPAAALRIAAEEGRFEREGWRVRKDGSRFWAHVVIDPIRSPQGEVIGFAKVTRDLTERKEAEELLRQSQRELEQAREALFQSQKMEAIGQLTGGVAHDFNNLLMAVLGSLELVRKRLPYDPRVTPLLENAIHGAERGAALTQRMLAFARKQELSLEGVDLANLVRGMLGLLQRSVGPAHRIDLRMPPGLPLVTSDPNQLETALLNLVVNARDAMPEGGVITISARPRQGERARPTLEAGDYIGLVVTDAGEGMDPDTLQRATEPFFTTKGVGKGTGLGLSMVHGLAAQSGGQLTIESRKGVGTAVELWLPVAAGATLTSAGESARAGAVIDLQPLRILAVDDDSLVLMNTVALLEDLGHQVVCSSSGEAALLLLKDNPDLDLVITDQVMPKMTGLQLREAIHEMRPELPVIIATGYAELPAGGRPDPLRLSKPFTQSELANAVIDAIGAPSAGGGGGQSQGAPSLH